MSTADDPDEVDYVAKVSEEKEKQFKKIFDQYDIEGDNSIMTSQLGQVLRSCGQIPTESWLMEHIAIYDPENTGKISWDNFVKVLKLLMEGGKEADDILLEAFRRFDPGVTGYIKCGEMREVLTTMGDILNDDEIEEFLTDADPLGQGVINYQGFVATLVQGPD